MTPFISPGGVIAGFAKRRNHGPPSGHRYLPISQSKKIFLKTADNPSSRLREEVSRSDGGGQKTPVCPACVRFVLRTNALTPAPLPQAGEGILFVFQLFLQLLRWQIPMHLCGKRRNFVVCRCSIKNGRRLSAVRIGKEL